MAATEIEKLERRYAENPQGLTFAPLAEIHRKNGDTTRALELLRAGLELHPNYIPASIVLGRCHWDLGDLPAAESAFSHVLRLDDENVIALKSLADINERLERFGDAQRWLNRLISVDRSNEEARHQLARIEAAKQGPASSAALPPETAAAEPKPPEPVVPPPVEPTPPAPASAAPLDLTAAIAEPAAPTPSQPTGTAAVPKLPVLQFLDTSEPAGKNTRPEPMPQQEGADSEEEPAALPGLISQEFVPPKETYRSHPELTQEFVSAREPLDDLEVETASEVELQSSGVNEFRVPNAAEDFMERETKAPPAPALDFIAEAPPIELPPLEPLPPERPAAERPPAERPPPVRPPPERSPALSKQSYSARDTKGQSVANFFQAMLAARPVGNAASSAPAGAPQSDAGPSAPSAPEAARGSSPAEDQPVAPELAVSFDDFFGAPAGGPSQPKASTDPGKDDLDQFQSWLQNLKR